MQTNESFHIREPRNFFSHYLFLKDAMDDHIFHFPDLCSHSFKVSSGYAEPLYHLAEVINQLDAIVGLAVAAVNGNFVRPKVK